MRGQRNVLGPVVVGVVTLALLSGAVATPVISSGASEKRESRAEFPLGFAGMPPPKVSAPTENQRLQAAKAYGRAPLSFEANQGQSDPSIKFLARGAGYQLSLT